MTKRVKFRVFLGPGGLEYQGQPKSIGFMFLSSIIMLYGIGTQKCRSKAVGR